MSFDETQGDLYQDIISFLSPPDGTATSSAALRKGLDWESGEIENAVKDLIAFGELELINVSQYARVRLRQPVPTESSNEIKQLTLADGTENRTVWHAYITEQSGTGRTRARRLYETREGAESHLKQIASVDSLTPVPGLEEIWCTTMKSSDGYKNEYAILRREPIFREAEDPYP